MSFQKVFASRRFPASEMTFGFIAFKDFTSFTVQIEVYGLQTFGDIFMYGRF